MADEVIASLTPEEQKKLILIEFRGGHRDGTIFRSDSPDPEEVKQCMGFYLLFSNHGTIGKRMRGPSDAGLLELISCIKMTPEGPRLKRPLIFSSNHVYEVVDRKEDADTIRVVYEYKGKVAD